MSTATTAPARHSPCISLCKLDDKTGFCLGCGRSGDEIAAWGSLDEAGQDAIWAKLPARLEALSVRSRLLPLAGAQFAAWVAETIEGARGTWVTGIPGALAEFPALGRNAEVTCDGDVVTAALPQARFRLQIGEKLRAFAFDGDGPVVLALPNRRAALETADGLAALGKDEAAIDPQDRDQELFDLGVGCPSSRFCIRTGDADFADALRGFEGRSWAELLAEMGAEIVERSPTRVVESALARIEVDSPIPGPGGASPAGPHTHFLPRFLEAGEHAPAGLKPPDYAAIIAIFYPGEPPA